MKGICKYCGKPAAYKNVNHCKKCHSLYCKRNYQEMKKRVYNERRRNLSQIKK